jgi:hypothetical protein
MMLHSELPFCRYYICPMHTFWFLGVYALMYFKREVHSPIVSVPALPPSNSPSSLFAEKQNPWCRPTEIIGEFRHHYPAVRGTRPFQDGESTVFLAA